jgi:hypothetical protein
MSYYPKNRIKTNLYTEGREYAIESTGQPYKGYYHKLYTGELFTGKTPSDGLNLKLILQSLNITSDISSNFPQSKGALELSDIDITDNSFIYPVIDEIYLKSINIYNEYTNLTGNPKVKFLPYPIIPLPTQQDYQLGEFRRYFAKKINEIKFIEINKDTYDNLNSQNSSWLWELYQVFFIPWSMSGDKQTVAKTNRNIVMLTMQRLNIYGFDKFLKENYTKFWLP